MIGDKKGLSTIVVTLIIVLLSLVAVGVVWVVVKNLITSGSQSIDINSKCLGVSIEVTKVNCSETVDPRICDVQLARTGTGTDAIGGVKLVFKNETTGVSSQLIDASGNIEPLVGKKIYAIDTGVDLAEGVLSTVEVTAYFEDDSGNQQICSETTTYNF